MISRNLYKLGADGIFRYCVLEHERPMIFTKVNEWIAGGNYAGKATAQNILCVGIRRPTIHNDAKEYYQACNVFYRVVNPSRRDEMHLHP